MPRLCLTAEGQTEQAFAFQLLGPHLADCGVYLARPRLTALAWKKGRPARGGVRRYEPIRRDILNWLKQDRARDVFFTTMIDLYRLPRDFPKQLHEFEALLLSEPDRFNHYYPESQREVESLRQLVQGFGNPELIDDGEQTAPSKRIGDLLPQYPGVKRTAGPIIAARIGLQTMRVRCPHFNEWLTKLEGLAAR